ncbi:MAG: pyridoxamine 5'-phosphate oxidase family protein [Pirellulales bacterium]
MKIAQAGDNFDVDATASRRLLDEVLARPLFAHLATDSEHGPRESPVWFLWEDETLWFIGNYQSDTFPKRIEREPRCAIGVVEFDIGGECRLHAFGSILQESRYTCTIRRMNRNVL